MTIAIINQFIGIMLDTNPPHHNLQRKALFDKCHELKNHQDLILDFYHFLITKNILRVGTDFTNSELPHMKFTKRGSEIFNDDKKRTAFIDEFWDFYQIHDHI